MDATHRPDAFTLAALQATSPIDAAGKPPVLPPLGLPLRRFRPPVPVQITCADGHLERIDSAVAHGTVRDWRGPWRTCGDWWEIGRAWARDEWDIELADGGLFRLVRLQVDGRWFIEGAYA